MKEFHQIAFFLKPKVNPESFADGDSVSLKCKLNRGKGRFSGTSWKGALGS